MEQVSLQCDQTDASCWIMSLSRPDRRNALSDELVGALLDCIDAARGKDVPALVFRGEGKNFSSGFDFSDFDGLSQAELLRRFVRIQQLLNAVLSYPGLTVAIAHGRNFGAGCDLFAACQVRLATADAQFRMPGVLFGLVLGTRRLGELVGSSHANRILLSTAEFSGHEAHRIGFVTDILGSAGLGEVGEENAMPSIRALAEAAARLPSSTRHSVTDILKADAMHEDMGRLVQSVMQGDIKQRLARYLGQ